MTTNMIFGLVGGLGMFIYGMRVMGDGLQKVAGDRLRRLLEVLTRNPILGVAVGAAVTAVIQSSSATTVMVVGFVNAGLLTLPQAAGVIMGANIGTTITAQLIAFKLTRYALPAIGLGVALLLFGRRRVHQSLGEVILGFGLLFVGMETMKVAMEPLRDLAWFSNAMVALSANPLCGVFVGVGMTSLVQSSSATIGILQALAAQGLLGLNVAVPILCGDNIGTTVTALLSSIGTSVTARRAAVIHLLFNIVGTLVFLILLPALLPLVSHLSSDVVRQIAHTHTLFNVANTAFQLPFIGLLVHTALRLVPGKVVILERGAKYLDQRLFTSPSIALGQATREALRMGELARDTVQDAIRGFFDSDAAALRDANAKEDVVDDLEEQITDYLVRLSNASLTDQQSERLTLLLNVTNDVERVGDHAQNIAELAEYRIAQGLPFSDQALGELESMCRRVISVFEQALHALRFNDTGAALEIIHHEDTIDLMEKELRRSHIKRLNEGRCYPGSGIVFLDIISNLERIGDHAANIAHGVLGDE